MSLLEWFTFWFKFGRKPLSGISVQRAPPPPPQMKIVSNFRFDITKVWFREPPCPQMKIVRDFRFDITKVQFRESPSLKMKIWAKVWNRMNRMWRLHLYPRRVPSCLFCWCLGFFSKTKCQFHRSKSWFSHLCSECFVCWFLREFN